MARRTLIPLDSQPQHAQALGRLLGHWGICEHNLCAILGNILGVEDHKARFIWAAFPSFAAKQKLLRRLNHHYTVNEVAKSSLEPYWYKQQNLTVNGTRAFMLFGRQAVKISWGN